MLPAVRGQASYTRLSANIPDVEFTLPGTDSILTFQGVELNRYQAEVNVTQPLLTLVRLRHEARAAEHEATAAALAAEQERADVAFEIRRAYWDLYGATDVRAALETALAAVAAHVQDARNRYEAGGLLLRDVLAAETRRSEVELERVEADNAVRVARLELNRLLGLPLDTPLRPSGPTQADTAFAEPSVPAEDALVTRPDLIALAEQVAGRRAAVSAAESRRIPELDFVSRYLLARPNPYFFSEQSAFKGTLELSLAARWDVWLGGRQGALEREARARLEAADARLMDARAQAAVGVARQQLEVRRAREALQVAARVAEGAAESFRVARQEYDEGAALAADVLEAEGTLRRARARQARSVADYAVARAAVLAALGRVW